MHMKPNFEDCSCEMFFGKAPPLKEVDENYGTPCYLSCPIAYPKPNNNNNDDDNNDINILIQKDDNNSIRRKGRQCS